METGREFCKVVSVDFATKQLKSRVQKASSPQLTHTSQETLCQIKECKTCLIGEQDTPLNWPPKIILIVKEGAKVMR
jgi:hypothetical protein